MTHTDEEMALILRLDKDLIFPATKVVVDIPAAMAVMTQNAQGSPDPMSTTGSVSTFQTMGTTQTQTTRKTKGKVKIPSATCTITSGTDTTISASTFSEKDINYLLSRIMQALQLPDTKPPPSKTPPGGNMTRQAK